jgi:hypothetical protein
MSSEKQANQDVVLLLPPMRHDETHRKEAATTLRTTAFPVRDGHAMGRADSVHWEADRMTCAHG